MRVTEKTKNSKLNMRSRNLKRRILNFELWFLVFSFPVLVILSLCGCALSDVAVFFEPDRPPSYQQLWESYNRTNLKESTAANVLATIHGSEHELLSQSKRVVACSGQKKRTYHTWLNMVAFDEMDLMAKRKYLLVINEKPKILFVPPKTGVTYDSEMVLESEVLDNPYANENARRIAILKQVLENLRKDIKEVEQDNKMLDICGMIVNQAMETVLVKLDESPALASRLSEPSGISFSHINLNKGKIGMLIEDDVVTVKMMLGSFVKHFEEREEPQQRNQ